MNIIHGAPIPPVGMLLYKLNSAYVLWTNYSLEDGNQFLDCAKLVKSLMLHFLCGVWYFSRRKSKGNLLQEQDPEGALTPQTS